MAPVYSSVICVWSRAALTTELQWQEESDHQLLSVWLPDLVYYQEILDDVLAFRFGGRKSPANHFKRPKTTVETKGAAAGTSTDREGKGCLKSDNQKGTGRILLSEYGVEASYYVSYDDDYHAATHHPPKNN